MLYPVSASTGLRWLFCRISQESQAECDCVACISLRQRLLGQYPSEED